MYFCETDLRFINSVITVWLVASVFCVLALERLWKNDFSVHANTMLYTAAGGVIINIM